MKHKSGGFTLIELMVVVVVIAILSAIAIPQYNDYVTRSRIPMATSTLADMSVRMEQYFQDNRTYKAVPAEGGGDSSPPCPANTQYFTFSGCPSESATTYTLTATGTGAMNGFTYTINESNTMTSTTSWGTSDNCWVVSKNGGC